MISAVMALSHAILVSLLEGPCSGYDLAKSFDGSVGFFWDASHQQIYRELSKLESAEALRVEKVMQDSRPNKKLYHITSIGEQILQAWIAKPCPISPIKDDLLVKLFGGYTVEPDILLQELLTHRQQHQDRLEEYKTIKQRFFQSLDDAPPRRIFQYLTLRSGIRYEISWLGWCDEAIAYLRENKLPPA
ncbi:MAG: PadR family transcriptional regulator [Cyanobacteria bacterium P01_A01_bin.123]